MAPMSRKGLRSFRNEIGWEATAEEAYKIPNSAEAKSKTSRAKAKRRELPRRSRRRREALPWLKFAAGRKNGIETPGYLRLPPCHWEGGLGRCGLAASKKTIRNGPSGD